MANALLSPEMDVLDRWEKTRPLYIQLTGELVSEARKWAAEHFGGEEAVELSPRQVVDLYLKS